MGGRVGGGPRKRAFRRATALPTGRRCCCPLPSPAATPPPGRAEVRSCLLASFGTEGGGARRTKRRYQVYGQQSSQPRTVWAPGSPPFLPPSLPPLPGSPFPIFRKGLPAHLARSHRVALAEPEMRKVIGTDELETGGAARSQQKKGGEGRRGRFQGRGGNAAPACG